MIHSLVSSPHQRPPHTTLRSNPLSISTIYYRTDSQGQMDGEANGLKPLTSGKYRGSSRSVEESPGKNSKHNACNRSRIVLPSSEQLLPDQMGHLIFGTFSSFETQFGSAYQIAAIINSFLLKSRRNNMLHLKFATARSKTLG